MKEIRAASTCWQFVVSIGLNAQLLDYEALIPTSLRDMGTLAVAILTDSLIAIPWVMLLLEVAGVLNVAGLRVEPLVGCCC